MPLLLKTGLLSRERSFLSQSCAQAAIPPLLSRVRNRPPRLSPLTFSTKDDQTHGLRYFAQELRVLFHTDAAQSVEQDSKQTYRRTPLDCDVMMTLGNSPQQAVIAFLKTLGIDINLVSYPAHSTVEAGRSLRGDMPGTFTKNLFLKDKKGLPLPGCSRRGLVNRPTNLKRQNWSAGSTWLCATKHCARNPRCRTGSAHPTCADS